MALKHILVIGGRRVVYLDARDEHLSPAEARTLAVELNALADQAEEVD